MESTECALSLLAYVTSNWQSDSYNYDQNNAFIFKKPVKMIQLGWKSYRILLQDSRGNGQFPKKSAQLGSG